MNNKKALFVGCSYTADCGFTPENQLKYHWSHLFCQKTEYDMVNLALGGMSNREIFLRAVEAVNNHSYDLVIVMWSEADRHWVYCSENNIDDYTIVNSKDSQAFRADSDYVNMYSKLHHTWFNNRYVNIKHWLLHSLSLEQILKYHGVPYIFIKGFHNHVNDLIAATYTNGFENFKNVKSFFDFDNRPDEYICNKLSVLKDLINKQDATHWLNLTGQSFRDSAVDYADDGSHPGPKTNALLAAELLDFYTKLND